MPRRPRPSRGGQGQRDIPPSLQSQPGSLGSTPEGRPEASGAVGLPAPPPREELAAHTSQVSAVGGRSSSAKGQSQGCSEGLRGPGGGRRRAHLRARGALHLTYLFPFGSFSLLIFSLLCCVKLCQPVNPTDDTAPRTRACVCVCV